MWVIPRAAVVLTDALLVDALLWALVTAGSGKIFQYSQQYFGICLYLQLNFLIYVEHQGGEGVSVCKDVIPRHNQGEIKL